MIEFSYQQAPTAADATRLFAAGTDAKYLGGGTNLVDLMRENIEHPQALVDVTRLSQEIDVRDDGSILIGAAAKNTAVALHSCRAGAFPGSGARDPERRVWPDPQHGHGRRQSAATHTLPVFLRSRGTLQQTRTRRRLRRNRRLQPNPRHPGRIAILCAPRIRPICAWLWRR